MYIHIDRQVGWNRIEVQMGGIAFGSVSAVQHDFSLKAVLLSDFQV